VVVNRTVELRGAGPGNSTIHWNGSEDIVTVSADGVVVSGFSIMRGTSFLSNCGAGVLVESNDSTIIGNNCSNNSYGILVRATTNVSLEKNTCLFSTQDGIMVESSTNATLGNNVCYLNDVAGLRICSSEGISVLANTLDRNYYYGVVLVDSFNITLSRNSFEKCGIYLWPGDVSNWSTHTIDSSNLVNGKPVYVLFNTSGATVPPGAGQVIITDCTEIRVEDQDFGNVTAGLQIGRSSEILVTNITCSYSWYGIQVVASHNITLEHNTVYFNRRSGIHLLSSPNCTVTGNICNANGATFLTTSKHGKGINIEDSNHTVISANTCAYNMGVGIYIYESSENSVTKNLCYQNIGEGIFAQEASQANILTWNNCSGNWEAGIRIRDGSDFSKIQNNTCQGNRIGIFLESSHYNNLTNNTISSNKEGIRLGLSARNNTARNNTIENNTEGGILCPEDEDSSIDARFNYWGADSGPRHPTGNPGGEGDVVTGPVEFKPWLDGDGNERFPESLEKDDENEDSADFFFLAAILLVILFVFWVGVRGSKKHRD